LKIEKYVLEITERQNIDIGGNMPTVLSVHEQNGELVMWIQLDEDYPGSFNIDVNIVETGNSFEMHGKYVNSVIMSSDIECHIYAKVNYIRAVE